MAVTVTGIAPAIGPPAGRTLITITGSGFPPDNPPPPGGTFPGTQAVVRIGGVAAENVQVFSAGLLTAITPRGTLGAADVAVENLLTAESDLVAGGFLYERPDFADDEPVIIEHVIETLRRRWADNVLENTTRSVDTDWASDLDIPFARTFVAEVPAITILAPKTPWNRFFSVFDKFPEDRGTHIVMRNPPHTVDLNMGIVIHADNQGHHISIAQTLLQDVHEYSWLDVSGSNQDVRYELEFVGDRQWRTTSTPNESNLYTQVNEIVVRGVQLFDRPGYPDDRVSERTQESQVVIRGFSL